MASSYHQYRLYNDQIISMVSELGWLSPEEQAQFSSLPTEADVSILDTCLEQKILTQEQIEHLQAHLDKALNEFAKPSAATTTEATSSTLSIHDYLNRAVKSGASDIHLGVGAPPLLRVYGSLRPLEIHSQPFSSKETSSLIQDFLTPEQWEELQSKHSIELSYEIHELARFRVSVVKQRKGFDAVFRIVPSLVRTIEEVGLPASLRKLTEHKNGLVLVTGPSGCGKSTTLSSFIEEINRTRNDHILIFDDPIEFVFTPNKCRIMQREVHRHTESFPSALRASLRQDPDVIVVGEMRDLETISLAITAAETGHLVFGTLHTADASRTLDRVLDVFPSSQQAQIRQMVSESLRGVISQQLIPRADGTGRVLASEILVNTPAVANVIREAQTFMLPGIIQTGRKYGMHLMDESIMALLEQKIISPTNAYEYAKNKSIFSPYLK